MEASSTTTICAVTWRALAILLLISSYALGDAVAAPKATDQALKDCYKDARDDMAGNFRHCGCISTDKEASTEPLSQKDGNVTIRTISDAFSEFQQYSFGLKSTFSDQRVRRGDEPAIHLSASALYQEASCTTGDPMDPSICASGMGRIEYVAGCVDSESEGGVRLSKDQCLSSIKKAMGHDCKRGGYGVGKCVMLTIELVPQSQSPKLFKYLMAKNQAKKLPPWNKKPGGGS